MPKMTRIRNERGQTMVELAMVLPMLLVLLLGIFQFGVAFNNYITLTDAVRAGARKAAVSRGAANPVADCVNEVLAAKGGLDPAKLGGPTCTSSWTSGSDVTVTANYPYSISLLNWVIVSGRFSSTMKERVE
jgi:Flp pilus assembly protein TadG